jgi:hypothetical protein
VIAHQFDRIGDWATGISASTAASSTAAGSASPAVGAPVPGRVCHTDVRLVPTVTETVVAYDEAARSLTYEATDGMPRFVALARSQWRVTPITETRTRVGIHARVDVRGPLAALARWWLLAQVARAGEHLLDDLKHYVEQGTASPRKQRRPGRAGDPVLEVGRWPTTRRLRASVRADAVLCLASGVTLMAAGWFLAAPWGLRPAAALPVTGAVVVLFGVLAAWVAVQPAALLRRWTIALAAADLAWVAASAALLAWYPLTATGAAAVAAVAVPVAALAGWQVAGLAAARADDPLADIEIVQATRVLAAAPADVWPRLTDHDLYGRLAPNLSTVQVTSQPGQPLRRRCTNTAGQSWDETCTVWDDGQRFAIDVDTSDYPYPLQLMRGLWQVAPDPGGSRVTMRFAYRAIPTVRGGLFTIGFRPLFPLALNRIFRGWQRTLPPTISRPAEPTPDRPQPPSPAPTT